MSDNMKEDTSLKTNLESDTELYEHGKKKENVHKDSCCEIFITIIFLIIFACIFIYILFADHFNPPPKFDLYANEKKEMEKQQTQKQNQKKQNPQVKKKDSTCPEGFYMPTNDKNCQKCSIENCSKCSGDKKNNICLSCMKSFNPVFDRKKRITSCMKVCEIGQNEKCLTCKKNVCGSCNIGYVLVKGNCILNHSFKAVYKTNHKKETINLINKIYFNDIVGLIIDNKKVSPSYNFTFPRKGEHSVIMLLNDENLITGKMMFFNITNLVSINFTSRFGSLNMISMRGMFKDCINLKSIELSSFKTSNVSDFSFMFDNCISLKSINISHFDTVKARDISYMFSHCKLLSTISLNTFNTINVKDMSGLFYGCTSLISIDLKNLNTQNVQFMLYMFGSCSALQSIDISSFNTKNTKDISYMFEGCAKLKSIDLSKFNSQNVTNMDGLFKGCNLLPSVDLSHFVTQNLKSANKLFYGCNNLKKVDISSFKNITWSINNELFNENRAKSGEIKITKTFYNLTKNNIPQKWKVIEVR